MSNKEILLILGNQLFPLEYIEKTKVNKIFMAEDLGLTTNHKHHKLKILMFLWSMRQYKDNLIKEETVSINFKGKHLGLYLDQIKTLNIHEYKSFINFYRNLNI